MSTTPQMIHLPPTPSDTLHLSREVCTSLAASTGDPSFTDQQVVFGLSAFLRTCGMLLAEQLNRQEAPLATD